MVGVEFGVEVEVGVGVGVEVVVEVGVVVGVVVEGDHERAVKHPGVLSKGRVAFEKNERW